ncbi:MAG TPA: response regulator [Acetobacteraceae bacterium]|nr:response regulator [Acetobacteraceae bacterium]
MVEDNILLRYTLAEWLRIDGHDVVEAASTDEATTILASPLGTDLVITDVEVPGSFDGLELAERIRRTSPMLPVIVVSGRGFTDRLQMVHVAAFFPKPYDLAQLSSFIMTLLHSADAPAERAAKGGSA